MEEIKGRLLLALAGTSDFIEATVQTVARTLSPISNPRERENTPFREAITLAARASIRAVSQRGGNLSDAATGIILGVMRSCPHTPPPQVMEVISHAAEITIREASVVGGDLSGAVRGLIPGALLGAKEINADPGEAARAAAHGALTGARQIGLPSFDAVQRAITMPVPLRAPASTEDASQGPS